MPYVHSCVGEGVRLMPQPDRCLPNTTGIFTRTVYISYTSTNYTVFSI